MKIDMRKICLSPWEDEFDYLQLDRNVKIGGCDYTIRICKGNI